MGALQRVLGGGVPIGCCAVGVLGNHTGAQKYQYGFERSAGLALAQDRNHDVVESRSPVRTKSAAHCQSFALDINSKRSPPGFEPGSTARESNVLTAEPRRRKLVPGADFGWPLGGLQKKEKGRHPDSNRGQRVVSALWPPLCHGDIT